MKRIIFSTLLFLFSTANVMAINWQPVYLNGTQCCSIDVDSIVKTDRFYFYSIKFKTQSNELVVVTLQSALLSPLSARIKVYPLDEYEKLDGDYSQTLSYQTNNLEPVTYGSVVSAAYKYVKTMEMIKTNSSSIIINND